MLKLTRSDDIMVSNQDLLDYLRAKPCSTSELATLCNSSEEDVLVALRVCRGHGLVETERRGKIVINRLTREAQTMLDQVPTIKTQISLG